MTPEEKDLILEYASHEIDDDQFVKHFPHKVDDIFFRQQFDTAILRQDGETIEYLFYLKDFIDENIFKTYLCRLIIEPWHRMHEDIALYLEFNYQTPDCIPFISKAIHMNFPYIDDDGAPFIRKCTHVLREMNTPESIKLLQELAKDSNQVIREYAAHQLIGI